MRRGEAARRVRRSGLIAVAAAALATLAACETTRQSADGRPMPPPPTAAPTTPPDASINAIALVFGPKPVDIDSDGRADLVELDAYLFARPFPSPTFAQGTLVFELFAPGAAASGAAPLGSWRFDPQRMRLLESRSMFGPCYRVQLVLREAGLARLPLATADLRTTFEPADGGPTVEARSVERIVLAGP